MGLHFSNFLLVIGECPENTLNLIFILHVYRTKFLKSFLGSMAYVRGKNLKEMVKDTVLKHLRIYCCLLGI